MTGGRQADGPGITPRPSAIRLGGLLAEGRIVAEPVVVAFDGGGDGQVVEAMAAAAAEGAVRGGQRDDGAAAEVVAADLAGSGLLDHAGLLGAGGHDVASPSSSSIRATQRV